MGFATSKYRTYFEVPFAEKELAKEQGLRWDPQEKKWYKEDFAETITFFGSPDLLHWNSTAELKRQLKRVDGAMAERIETILQKRK